MEEALAEFLRHLALERNASAHTVKSYREDLTQAIDFFRTRLGHKSPRPQQLTTRLLRAHLAWLSEQGYARSTIGRRLAAVRSWCRFLCRQGTLSANPALGLRGPRQDKKLPHFVSREDMGRLLETPPAGTPLGLRDRAILETLYSAGLRVSELTGLDVGDVDLNEGMAMVRGKGRKERLALLGPPAVEAIARWMPQREALAGRERRANPPCTSTVTAHACRRAAWAGCWRNTWRGPDSIGAPARTRCATVSPPTCSTPAPTSAACRSCSATAAWPRRRYTRM